MSNQRQIHLRPISVSDAQTLYHFWSDPDVTPFMNITPMQSVEQAEELILYITHWNMLIAAHSCKKMTRSLVRAGSITLML